jgi:hypothetical protein
MITRKEYLENSKELHYPYYFQFANKATKELILRSIGKGRIKKSNNKYFNDIPLSEWDKLSGFMVFNKTLCMEVNGQVSLSDRVCILKAVAENIRSNSIN